MLSDCTAATPGVKFLPLPYVSSLCMHAVHAATRDTQCTAVPEWLQLSSVSRPICCLGHKTKRVTSMGKILEKHSIRYN